MRLQTVFLALLLPAAVLRAAPPVNQSFSCRDCSLILVSLDAVQAAHLRSFGYAGDPAPGLEKLFARSAVFTGAVSPAPWTVPATMSVFTGVHPSSHGVVNKFSVFTKERKTVANVGELSPGLLTLAQVLKASGYATGGFTGDAGVNGMFGFNRGFDVYSDSVPAFSGFDRSVPPAAAWLKANKGKKFFLFLHGYNAHGQSVPEGGLKRRYVEPNYPGTFTGSPAEQGRLREEGLGTGRVAVSTADAGFWRAVYDEKISVMDSQVSDFFAWLKAGGYLDKTLVVFFADHGTELFEHGRIDHGFTLYDELVRVPLAFARPGAAEGFKVAAQVSTLDIFPTVLDLLGLKAPAAAAQHEGRSLVPLLRARAGEGSDAFMETDYRLYTHKRGLRTADGWKLVHTLETKKSELYNLNSDPGEKTDLYALEKRRAYLMENRVLEFFRLSNPAAVYPVGCSPVYADQCK